MNKKIVPLIAIAIFVGKTNECVSAQLQDNNPTSNDKVWYQRPHKCPKPTSKPQVSYNSASTVLSVSFHGNRQGGKVEIYRNGAKVVSTAAPAGASLSFVLRNYGKGDYTVIVSQGNMVVFSNNVEVK